MRTTWPILMLLLAAGPVTKPAVTPEAEIKSLRAEVKRQSEEIAVLKARVTAQGDVLAQVRKELRELSQAVRPGTPQPTDAKAPAPKKLAPGMTLAQVERVVGRKGQLQSSDSDDREVYEWQLSNSFDVVQGTKGETFGTYTLLCVFHSGKLDSFRRIDNNDRRQ